MKNKYITITVGILIVIAIVVFGNVFLIKSIDVVFERKPLNVNEANIVEASKIAIGSNIFSLDEKSAATGIADFYPNNTVYVQSIERVFPNKVIIYVKERTPVLSVAYGDGGEECIPTDIDFQMTRKALIADIDFDKIIIVSGVSVLNTFNTSEFRRIKEVISAFEALGLTEEAMITFINEINVSDDKLRIILRGCDTVLELSLTSGTALSAQTQTAYADFLELPYEQRSAVHISVQ